MIGELIGEFLVRLILEPIFFALGQHASVWVVLIAAALGAAPGLAAGSLELALGGGFAGFVFGIFAAASGAGLVEPVIGAVIGLMVGAMFDGPAALWTGGLVGYASLLSLSTLDARLRNRAAFRAKPPLSVRPPLPAPVRAAAFTALAEVLGSEYERFAIRTKSGDRTAFRECLNEGWNRLAGRRFDDDDCVRWERRFDKCLPVPDLDDAPDGATTVAALRAAWVSHDEADAGVETYPRTHLDEQAVHRFLSEAVRSELFAPGDWSPQRVDRLRDLCVASRRRVDWNERRSRETTDN